MKQIPNIEPRSRGLIVTVLVLITVVGCQAAGATQAPTTAPTAAAPSTTAAASATPSSTPLVLKPATLRLDWSWLAYHMPFVYALNQGYYKAAGIDLTIEQGQGSGSTLTLVATGKDTFGFADTSTMLLQASKGQSLENVLVIQRRSGFGTACLKSVNYQKPTDLEGHSVLLIPQESTAAIFPAWEKINSVDPSRVRIVNADFSNKVQLLVAQKADCMVGYVGEDTLNAQLLNPNVADAIAWVDQGIKLMGHGIEISPQTAKDDPAMVSGFVAATIKGWQAICANPQIAVDLLKTEIPSMKAVDIQYAMLGMPIECAKLMPAPGDTGSSLSATTDTMWQSSIDLMAQYGGMASPQPPSTYYTNQFLPTP